MPYSNKAKRYPFQYFEALDILDADQSAQFPIQCTDEREARGVQRHVGKFRDVLLKDPTYSQYHNIAESLMIRVKGNVVILLHRDYSPDAQRMQAALDAFRKEQK